MAIISLIGGALLTLSKGNEIIFTGYIGSLVTFWIFAYTTKNNLKGPFFVVTNYSNDLNRKKCDLNIFIYIYVSSWLIFMILPILILDAFKLDPFKPVDAYFEYINCHPTIPIFSLFCGIFIGFYLTKLLLQIFWTKHHIDQVITQFLLKTGDLNTQKWEHYSILSAFTFICIFGIYSGVKSNATIYSDKIIRNYPLWIDSKSYVFGDIESITEYHFRETLFSTKECKQCYKLKFKNGEVFESGYSTWGFLEGDKANRIFKYIATNSDIAIEQNIRQPFTSDRFWK